MIGLGFSQAAQMWKPEEVTIYKVTVEVHLLPGVADPQGATIERSLATLGFGGVTNVRMGKAITFMLEADNETKAAAEVNDLCQRFLINPVIEDAAITITEADKVAEADKAVSGR